VKKVAIGLGIVVVVVLIAAGAFYLRYSKMTTEVKSAYDQIADVNLAKIPDGAYSGSFGDFLVSVDLTVTVKDSAISDITVNEQSCGKGYEALETVDRIIQAQSPRVDAVTGATGSSMTIMVAAYRALTSQ
jgi:uncharacterized protein with FMN-binding domain